MVVAYSKLHGLDGARVLAIVEPVLRAHGVEGVELVWRTDRGGWLLELTVEKPEARIPGMGISVELCTEISRDISSALDVADVIPQRYRLEVGSPGLDRTLYAARDYARFAGQLARIKLNEPIEGQSVVRGTLHGLDDAGRVLLETEHGELALDLASIDSARLVFDWSTAGKSGKGKNPSRRAMGRGR